VDPKQNRAPEPEEPETVDDEDVVMVDEDSPDRDTIPPDEPLVTTESIPLGDAEVEDALLDEELGDVFSRIRTVSVAPPPPTALSEDELEAQREAEFEALLERSKKPT
jgi:hypothetical protein